MWLKIMSQSEKLGEGKGHDYGWVVKGRDLFFKSGGQKIENKSVPEGSPKSRSSFQR